MNGGHLAGDDAAVGLGLLPVRGGLEIGERGGHVREAAPRRHEARQQVAVMLLACWGADQVSGGTGSMTGIEPESLRV